MAGPRLASAAPVYHVVKQGESLSGIAEKYFGRETNVFDPKHGALVKLRALNPWLSRSSPLLPGTRLLVQRDGAPAQPDAAEASKEAPVVRDAPVAAPKAVVEVAQKSETKLPAQPKHTSAGPDSAYPDSFFQGQLDGSVESQNTVTETSSAYPAGFLPSGDAPERDFATEQPPQKVVRKAEPTEASVSVVTSTTTTVTATAKAPGPLGTVTLTDPMDRYPPGFLANAPAEEPVPARIPPPPPEEEEETAPEPAPAPAPLAKIEETDPMDRYPKDFLGRKAALPPPPPAPVKAPRPGAPQPRGPVPPPEAPYVEPSYGTPPAASSPGFSYAGSYSGGGGGSVSYGSYSSHSSSGSFPHSRFAFDLGLDYFRIDGLVPRTNGRAVLASQASPQGRFTWTYAANERWGFRLRFAYTGDQQQTGATASSISGGNGARFSYSLGAIRRWSDTSRTVFGLGSSTRLFLRSTTVSSVNVDRAQLLGLSAEHELDLLVGEEHRGGVAGELSLISGGTGAGYTMGVGYGGALKGYFRHEFSRGEWDARGELYYGFSKQNSSLVDQKEQHLGLLFGVSKRFD